MHPKGQGECKHRLLGMCELLQRVCTQDMAQGMHGSRDAAASCPCPAGLAGQGQRPLPSLQHRGCLWACRAAECSSCASPPHHTLAQISLLPCLVLPTSACGIQGRAQGAVSACSLTPSLPPSALGGTNKGCSWSLNPREQLRDILLYPTTAQHSQHRPPAAPAPSSPHTTEGQHRTQVRATETLF